MAPPRCLCMERRAASLHNSRLREGPHTSARPRPRFLSTSGTAAQMDLTRLVNNVEVVKLGHGAREFLAIPGLINTTDLESRSPRIINDELSFVVTVQLRHRVLP